METFLDLRHGWQARVAQQCVHGHDEARRAESALRAVRLGQSLLDGVQAAWAAALAIDTDAFHRRHGPTVQCAHRGQASVGRQMPFVFIRQKKRKLPLLLPSFEPHHEFNFFRY